MPFSSHPAAKAGEAERMPTKVATNRYRKEREKVVIVELPQPEQQSSTKFVASAPPDTQVLSFWQPQNPRQSRPQSPNTACTNARAATAAVSARKIRGPSAIRTTPCRASKAALSSSANPPSGP